MCREIDHDRGRNHACQCSGRSAPSTRYRRDIGCLVRRYLAEGCGNPAHQARRRLSFCHRWECCAPPPPRPSTGRGRIMPLVPSQQEIGPCTESLLGTRRPEDDGTRQTLRPRRGSGPTLARASALLDERAGHLRRPWPSPRDVPESVGRHPQDDRATIVKAQDRRGKISRGTAQFLQADDRRSTRLSTARRAVSRTDS